MLSQIFSGNVVKGCQPFSLSLCNISKMPHFQILLHPWVQKKKLRGARSGKHNHHFVFSQKLLDTEGCLGSGIVMVQEPSPTLPLFWMFMSQALTTILSTHSSKTADILCVLNEQTACELSHQHQEKTSTLF
jgi:hypothetical protein